MAVSDNEAGKVERSPTATCDPRFLQRPCRVDCTGSLLTSEVKRLRAWLVLGSGTAWEYLRVLHHPACLLLTAIPSRMHRISFDLQS